MKRLTSMLLALLMLVGMALAEETPEADPALGDWYVLNVDGTTECLTLREDGTFCYGSREGTWRKMTDGEYWLTFSRNGLLDVMASMVNSQIAEQDLTALLTETGFDVYYGSTAKGTVVHMVRDVTELQNARTPKTDTPLEAFAGTWTMETVFAGAMEMTYTPDKGERQVFCTIDGLTLLPGAGLESFPEGTSFPLTFEDGDGDEQTLPLPDPAPGPEELAELTLTRDALIAAMAQLLPEHRTILELRVCEQLPYEQIADILDIQVGTVKSRLSRARTQLKKILERGNLSRRASSESMEGEVAAK